MILSIFYKRGAKKYPEVERSSLSVAG